MGLSLRAALERFEKLFAARLQAAGIDSGQRIELTSDGFGQVHVVGDHPDRAAIESLVADDPGLDSMFRRLGELFESNKQQSAGFANMSLLFDNGRAHVVASHAATRAE